MAKRKQSRKQRKQVKRTTRHFQLRVDHPQDAHVREILDYARSQRREVTLIRDAVALFWALENNDLEPLFEKFPQYRAKFSGDGGQGGGGVTNEALQAFMDILRAQNNTGGYVMKSTATVPALAAPKVEVKQTASSVSADEIADNFMSAFF